MMLDELGIDFMELVKEGNNFDEIKLCLKKQFPKETKETENYHKLIENFGNMSIQELRKHFVRIIPKIVNENLRHRFISDLKGELFKRFAMKIPYKEFRGLEILFPKKLVILIKN